MQFFVRYSTFKYESDDKVFDNESKVIEFLNSHASNPDFKFDVIQGSRVIFEPVSVATQYRRK